MTNSIPPRPDVPMPEPRVISHGASVELRLENVPPITPQARPQVATPADWTAGREWLDVWAPPFDVVRGEYYREETLAALTGPETVTGYAVPVELELVRDQANTHDSNAIRVEVSGELVGYIARELAALFAPVFDKATAVRCRYPGVIVGGSSHTPEREVFVWLDRRLSEGPSLDLPLELVFAEPVWPPIETLGDEAAAEIGIRRTPDLDGFYALDREIEEAWSARHLGQVAERSRECVAILPAFVAEATVEREHALSELRKWTEDPTIPDDVREVSAAQLDDRTRRPITHHLNAVEYGGQVFAATGDREGLEGMRATVAALPELASFLPAIDDHIAQLELIERVLEYVAGHPGAIQKDLHASVGADKDAVRFACYLAAMAGRLARTKRGASYALEIPA